MLLPLVMTYFGDSLVILPLWSPPFLACGSQTSLSLVLGPTLGVVSTLQSSAFVPKWATVNLQHVQSEVHYSTPCHHPILASDTIYPAA